MCVCIYMWVTVCVCKTDEQCVCGAVSKREREKLFSL